MSLALHPPFPPMEALSVDEVPQGSEWQYEPKWDGFRCLLFRDGDTVELQSKSGQPLTRYFPEIVEAARKLNAKSFVLDGEIVVPAGGAFSFDDLLQRIHPAASRIARLAGETPALLVVFDLLASTDGADLTELNLAERRQRLEQFARK
jgi:ATP-dependent DNA ligase